MPAPSLLIICLPSQTKVAPRPVPPVPTAQSSDWGTPSRHRNQEQWLVLDSACTQHTIQLCCLGCSACLSARCIRGSCRPDGVLPAPLPGPAGRRGERASGCGAALARGCAAWLRRDRRHRASELQETSAVVARRSPHIVYACSFRKLLLRLCPSCLAAQLPWRPQKSLWAP